MGRNCLNGYYSRKWRYGILGTQLRARGRFGGNGAYHSSESALIRMDFQMLKSIRHAKDGIMAANAIAIIAFLFALTALAIAIGGRANG